MKACTRLRTLLFRSVEGELDPEEALRIGRHLQDCTVCRIVLARHQRLADMVDAMGDPIEVDESFLESVMSTLPEGTPPRDGGRRSRHRNRRGLKLAGIAVAAGLLGALFHQLHTVPTLASLASHLNFPEIEVTARVMGGVQELARFLVGFVVGAGADRSWNTPSTNLPAFAAVAVVVPVFAAIVTGAAVIALAVLRWSHGLNPVREL